MKYEKSDADPTFIHRFKHFFKIRKQFVIRKRHKIFLALIAKKWRPLVFAMFCMVVTGLSSAASAFLVKPVLDDVFLAKNQTMLKIIPAALLAIYMIRALAHFGQEYLLYYVGQNILRELRNLLYNRIMDLPLSFFQKEKTGGLISRVMNDVGLIKSMTGAAATGLLRDAFAIAGLIGVLFYRDWKLALIGIVVLPLGLFPIYYLGKKVRRVSTACQISMADLSSFVHETFIGAKIVKAFCAEKHENKRFSQKTTRLFRREMKFIQAQSLSSPVVQLLAGVGIASIIWYGGFKVIRGESTPGAFFSFITALVMLYDPVRKLSRLNNSIQQGLAALDRVFNVIEQKSEIDGDGVKRRETIGKGPLGVVFENVWFQYGAEAPVLKSINLDVRPGEVIAVVGRSGSGKTSMVNLIPRFFEINRGAILVGGADIRKVPIPSLRRRIAIVTQDSVLFNESIKDNIAYGSPGCSMAEIEVAARASYAYDFVTNLPDGFESNVGEGGVRLSGGEKQRICIARALIKNAPILILDEATSALDSESEAIVQKALDNLVKGRTTFIVAHRYSTIRRADRIVVLSDGEIEEIGTHEELIGGKGQYQKHYGIQQKTASGARV